MEPLQDFPQVSGVERRYVPQKLVELRAVVEDGKDPIIDGLVAVYDSWSPVYDWFRERISSSFFEAAIGRDDVRALFNHDVNYVLGRSGPGTLELTSEKAGLRGRVTVSARSQLLRDLVILPLERRDVTGASFSFDLPPEGGVTWKKGADGVWERTLEAIGTLYDVGPVTFPFYPDTAVGVRSAMPPAMRSAMHLDEAKRSLEEWLHKETGARAAGHELDLLSRRMRMLALG